MREAGKTYAAILTLKSRWSPSFAKIRPVS